MDCMSSNDENTILFGCQTIIKERYAASCQVIIRGNDPQPVLYLSENKIWMCVLTDHDYWFRSSLICLAILICNMSGHDKMILIYQANIVVQ